jgi:hypothetical protein
VLARIARRLLRRRWDVRQIISIVVAGGCLSALLLAPAVASKLELGRGGYIEYTPPADMAQYPSETALRLETVCSANARLQLRVADLERRVGALEQRGRRPVTLGRISQALPIFQDREPPANVMPEAD